VAEERRLVVLGREETFLVEPKSHLLEALQRAGVPVRTSCGGVGTCGLCRVTVRSGAECLTELKGVEEHHLGNVASIVGLRLACQARYARPGEVRVEVPPVEDVQERRKRKLERARSLEAEAKPAARPKPARVEWRPRKLEGRAEHEAQGPLEPARPTTDPRGAGSAPALAAPGAARGSRVPKRPPSG
jgi:ferredoxin